MARGAVLWWLLPILLTGCPHPYVISVDQDGDTVLAELDCDDHDPDTYPGAEERCDDLDHDCDGEPYDGFDADRDGYVACPDGGNGRASDCDDDDSDVYPGADIQCSSGPDSDCDGTPDTRQDRDGDGIAVCMAGNITPDCDDGDASVNPDALELCGDGIDNDCDGWIDLLADDDPEGVNPRWYPDADEDGYGDAHATPVPACLRIPGSVSDGTDCDDTTSTLHPGAPEVACDGIDQDCDGPDDDHPDADHDGYDACPPGVPGADDRPADCLDQPGGSDVHPGATEVCDDGIDEDCDGSSLPCPLEGTIELETHPYVLRLAGAGGDALGTAVSPVLRAGDGGWTIALGAPAGANGEGVVYVCPGSSLTAPGERDATALCGRLTGAAGSGAGRALARAGTPDGTGSSGLLVGGPSASDVPGRCWLVLTGGLPKVGATASLDQAAAVLLRGSSNGDGFGSALSALPAGAEATGWTVLIGAPKALDPIPVSTGAAIRFLLPIDDPASGAGSRRALFGEASGDQAGSAVLAVVDPTSGAPLLLVGAPGYDDLESSLANVGRVYGAPDTGDSDLRLGGAALRIAGANARLGAGQSLAWLDLDGSGDADLIIGTPRDTGSQTSRGTVFVFAGSSLCGSSPCDTSGAAPPLVDDTSSAQRTLAGEDYDEAATALATGDVDGDGLEDLAIGAPGHDDGRGAVFILFAGSQPGSSELVDAAGAILLGAAGGDRLGASIAIADVNGDGHADVVAGAPGAEGGAGAAFVVFGHAL